MAQNIAPSAGASHKTNSDNPSMSKDNQTVTKRLQSELMRLMMAQNKEFSAFPDGDNLFKWIGTIVGPADTAYEKQVYKLSFDFNSDYPYTPPNVRFITPCFHPNIDFKSGTICLDILKEKWSALLDVQAILLSLQSLLGEPNNNSPLNVDAAKMWRTPTAFKKHLTTVYEADAKTTISTS